jgi:hypothetical protein
VEYEIADVTAAATYYLAETYFNFSRSLLESERPTNLKAEELKAFDAELDETAFPFEEKAIKVHEKNMELLHKGVFNEWTEKSLSRLGDMMPGRYAKHEVSSGFLDAIDTYVYRSPAAQIPVPAPASTDATPAKQDPTKNGSPSTEATPAKQDPTKNGARSTDTTPAKQDSTTHGVPVAADNGVVKHANPQ